MDPAIIAVFIPIVAMFIPIVYMLIKHQQKMAEIVHSKPQNTPEVDSLRTEVAELKAMLHQQMISMDSMMSQQKSISTPPSMPERLTN